MSDEPMKTIARQTENAAGIATEVIAWPFWKMIAVRVARVYLQTFLGLLGADGMGAIELGPAGDAWSHLLSAALVALAPAAVSLLQNSLEFLTKIDVNAPGLRA
jgi:hypothetical protein